MKSLNKHFRDQLEQLLLERESSDLEFKSAAGGFPKSFWETYSAFANTEGGTIVLGVKEKDGMFYADGLTAEKTEKYRRDFFNLQHNRQSVNVALIRDDDVESLEIEGVSLLLFRVPRADRSLRPVYCGQDPYMGTYRRDSDGDYHCSAEEVRSMFADSDLQHPVDGRILPGFGKADLDESSIRQYRRKFEQWSPDHVWNSLADEVFLERLNVLRRDRGTGALGLTHAGLLMFGTYSAIQEACPNFFPDYREVQDPQERWVNRICPDGNWESNLFQFYSRVLPILQNFLPQPFQLVDNQRRVETPARVAVREALTNALVHADYTLNASLTVIKHPDRIVFSNPGTMLISREQFYRGGESVCRNRYLQTMFTFLGSAEKAGSGVDKILRGWEESNWKQPYIEERSRPNKVELTLPLVSLFDESTQSYLRELFGERLDAIPHEQLMTLAIVATEEETTNERLQYALNLHRSDITKMLKHMCEQHLLNAVGRGRGTKYSLWGANPAMDAKSNLPTRESQVASGAQEGGNKLLKDGNKPSEDSNKPSEDSNKPSEDSNKPSEDSNRPPEDSNKFSEDSNKPSEDSNKPPEDSNKRGEGNKLCPDLREGAITDDRETVDKTQKRYGKGELESRILEFCSSDWRAAEDIAQHVQRRKDYVTRFIGQRMQGRIETLYSVPHHPRQKYRKKS